MTGGEDPNPAHPVPAAPAGAAGPATQAPVTAHPPYPAPYPYPPPYWGPPGPSAPAGAATGLGTASGILGMVGIAMAVIPAVYWLFYKASVIGAQTYTGLAGVNTLMGLDLVVATLAIVFGAVGLTRPGARRDGLTLAHIGLALGVVSLVLAVIFLPLVIAAANAASCTAYPGSC